jgi:AcrR family transcriptional regulator
MAQPDARTVPQGKRRRPLEGGYARGEETRLRIINAALEVFGLHGFDAASTRMIAAEAGVNLPALQYYFNSKEGVYLACAEHIADRLDARLGPLTRHIAQTVARQNPSREQLLQMLDGLLDTFAELFLGEHELERWVLFIIREQAHPTKAFDIIYDRVMRRVAGACIALVARLLGLPRDNAEVRIRAAALIGQIVFFRTAREAVLRVLGWSDFNGRRLQIVKDVLHAQIMSAFEEPRKAAARRRS